MKNFFKRDRRPLKFDGKREVNIGNVEENIKKYPTNFISTTKYNLVTFFPMSLYYQFIRVANIYFQVSAILNSIELISPLSPQSAIMPLVFVISLSLVREAYEDLQRHKSDVETNACKVTAIIDNYEHEVSWSDINAGDVVKIYDEEFFPADLVLLSVCTQDGVAYMQTGSLDGEKAPKQIIAIPEIQEKSNEITEDKRDSNMFNFLVKGKFSADPPDANLYKAHGQIDDTSLSSKSMFWDQKNLLLRGANLINTEYIYGLVVYTGLDTKIMRNGAGYSHKTSQIEKQTGWIIMLIFLFQIICCTVISIGAIVWNCSYGSKYSYFIEERFDCAGEGLLTFLTQFALTTTMVPISLIISLELVKLIQAGFIAVDIKMFKKENDEGKQLVKVLSSSLNEELGQINYIFSDKTGTMTSNTMVFKYAVIGNECYGDKHLVEKDPKKTEVSMNNSFMKKKTIVGKKNGVEFDFASHELSKIISDDLTPQNYFVDEINIAKNSNKKYSYTNQKQLVDDFFFNIALCNECLIENPDANNVSYQGPSPDEVTLTHAAYMLDYKYAGNDKTCKKVIKDNVIHNFIVHKWIGFDSDRKRSSIIVEDENGLIKHYMKGADSIILDRLSPNDQVFTDVNVEWINKFSNIGLRCLAYCVKLYTKKELEEIKKKFYDAENHEDREKELIKVQNEIEQGFFYIGSSAVEDKLQDDVPECIADFLKADIKVWMLTGDKLQTAENIGYSCSLIQSNFEKIYITANDNIEDKEHEVIGIIEKQRKDNVDQKICLLLEGSAVTNILKSDEFLKKSYVNNVLTKCDSVICCRVSPKEKAYMVELVKKYQGKVTLAVGDGANDVNMIMEAHIGVGIYGKEGMRATQAADFAIPEFRALWRLLMCHGRWSYIRNAEMVLYFFYKNIVFTMPMMLFAFYNGFSGQTIYDDYYITFYNLAFTNMPLLVNACSDKDFDYYRWTDIPSDPSKQKYEEMVLEKNMTKFKYVPYLYYIGQHNTQFKRKNLIINLIYSVLIGTIIFLVCYYATIFVIIGDRHTPDVWYYSMVLYTSILLVVDFKLMLSTRTWSMFNIIGISIFSQVLYFVAVWICNLIPSIFLSAWTAKMLFSSGVAYLLWMLFSASFFIIDLQIVLYRKHWNSTLHNLFNSINKEDNNLKAADMYDAAQKWWKSEGIKEHFS